MPKVCVYAKKLVILRANSVGSRPAEPKFKLKTAVKNNEKFHTKEAQKALKRIQEEIEYQQKPVQETSLDSMYLRF